MMSSGGYSHTAVSGMRALSGRPRQSRQRNRLLRKRRMPGTICRITCAEPAALRKGENPSTYQLAINSCRIGLKLSINLAVGVSRQMVCFWFDFAENMSPA